MSNSKRPSNISFYTVERTKRGTLPPLSITPPLRYSSPWPWALALAISSCMWIVLLWLAYLALRGVVA